MVTIEYNGQSVECDDAKAAQAELKRLQRAERKVAAELDAKREKATAKALRHYASLMDSVCAVIDGSSRPFRIYMADNDSSGVYAHHCGERRYAGSSEGLYYQTIKVSSPESDGSIEMFGWTLEAVMVNGAGTLAVKLGDKNPEETHWAAVGIFDGVIVFETIPRQLGQMIETAALQSAERKQAQ